MSHYFATVARFWQISTGGFEPRTPSPTNHSCAKNVFPFLMVPREFLLQQLPSPKKIHGDFVANKKWNKTWRFLVGSDHICGHLRGDGFRFHDIFQASSTIKPTLQRQGSVVEKTTHLNTKFFRCELLAFRDWYTLSGNLAPIFASTWKNSTSNSTPIKQQTVRYMMYNSVCNLIVASLTAYLLSS